MLEFRFEQIQQAESYFGKSHHRNFPVQRSIGCLSVILVLCAQSINLSKQRRKEIALILVTNFAEIMIGHVAEVLETSPDRVRRRLTKIDGVDN